MFYFIMEGMVSLLARLLPQKHPAPHDMEPDKKSICMLLEQLPKVIA